MRDLETDRLRIRALRPDDLDAWAALVTDCFGGPPDPVSYRDQLAFNALADPVHDALHQPPYGDRAIALKESNAVVGAVGFVHCLAPFAQLPSEGAVSNARSTPEVGLFWAMASAYRGRGLITEA